MGLVLPAVVLALRNASWKGDSELHTVAETIACGLALTAGSMALVRYYTKKDQKFLLIGSGFVGAALLDGYHAAITSSILAGYAPSSLSALTPWSGATSRLFLSLLMLSRLFFWEKDGDVRLAHCRETVIYLVVASWTLISFLFFAFVRLSPPFLPQWYIHRPAELIPGALFAIATLGYISKGLWKSDLFEHWLVLSLILATASHVALPLNGALFDSMYFAGHLLKIVQYVLAVGGLYVSMYCVFRSEAESARSLCLANQSLASEIAERQRAEAELLRTQEELESRVKARTQGLAVVNDALSAEIAERHWAEEQLTKANAELKSRAEELERQTREMQLFAQLASALRACADLREAEGAIAKVLALAFPHCSGAVCMLNNSRNLVQPAEHWGGGAEVASFAPDHCCALRLGRVHLGDGTQLLDCAHVPEHAFYLCAPLIAQGEILGTIFIQAEAASDLGNSELMSGPAALAQAIAEQVAMALSSLRLRHVLRDAAIRDPLTGLFNRRYMEETFSRELARCTRNHAPLTVLMIDVDDFKGFNDRHGHDVGDLVLKHAGVLLKSSARAEDVVCRFGGEEFVIILPGADLETSARRANELRVQFASMCVSHRGSLIEPVTVSLGVACTSTDGSNMEDLLLASDRYLYAAKAAGRNRVCSSLTESLSNAAGSNQAGVAASPAMKAI
jgi:diguanylate cyclase (GGDEF)-like protein